VRVIVYVDGFNLYYGALRWTAYKWLDLGKLCQKMVPRDEIVGIKYFTALVKPRPGHPHTAQSQQIYLRALQTIPDLSIHLGHFITKPVSRSLVKPPKQGTPFRLVWNTEEKGSDVNLASYLLIDGFRARYDMAVVISNDGDLKEPIRFVRYDLKAPVGVLNPHPNRSYALSPPNLPRGSFYKPIRKGALASSQFPTRLTDAQGRFRKPSDW
jgi:NYN domain